MPRLDALFLFSGLGPFSGLGVAKLGPFALLGRVSFWWPRSDFLDRTRPTGASPQVDGAFQGSAMVT